MKKLVVNLWFWLLIVVPVIGFQSTIVKGKELMMAMDFRAYYLAAKMWKGRVREGLYSWDIQKQWQNQTIVKGVRLLPFIGVPAVIVMYLPLGWFSYGTAYEIWWFINGLLIISGVLIIYKNEKNWWPWLVGLVGYKPGISAWVQGQIIWLFVFGVGFAIEAYTQGKKFKSGLWLASLALNPQYLIALPVIFIIRKQYRMLAGLMVGGMVVGIINGVMTGGTFLKNYSSLVEKMLSNTNGFSQPVSMEATWFGLINTFGEGLSEPTKLILWGVGIFLVIWGANWGKTGDFDRSDWAMTLLIMVFSSLHTGASDLTILLLPAYWIYQNILNKNGRMMWVFGVVVVGWMFSGKDMFYTGINWPLPVMTILLIFWLKANNAIKMMIRSILNTCGRNWVKLYR